MTARRIVTVYLNESADAGYGLNATFEYNPLTGQNRQAVRPGWHRLTRALDYEAPPDTPPVMLLEEAAERLGLGASPDGLARPLCIGDVLQVDGRFYSCEPVGWAVRVPAELNLVSPVA